MSIEAIVSLAISGLSLLISLILVIRVWYTERFQLTFRMVKFFDAAVSTEYPFHLWLSIVNRSSVPCAIEKITVRCQTGKVHSIAWGDGGPCKIYGTEGSSARYSFGYPYQLEGYGSVGGYFSVFHRSGSAMTFEECNAEIEIATSRGSVKKTVFMDTGLNVFRCMQASSGEIPKDLKHADGTKIEFLNSGDVN